MTRIAQEAAADEHALADIAEAVNIARQAILELVGSSSDATWRPRQLIDAAKNALAERKISKTIVAIAFWNMVDAGDLVVDEHMIVHALALAQSA